MAITIQVENDVHHFVKIPFFQNLFALFVFHDVWDQTKFVFEL